MLQPVDDLMPIGEFSERSGLSPKRLRTYAAGGLLVPTAVDSASGYRYYSPGQLREARLIDTLRTAGMPLSDIAALLRDPSVGQLDRWAKQVEVDAAQRQEALQAARQFLDIDAEQPGRHPYAQARREAMTRFRTAVRTDIGRVRNRNEDAVLALDSIVAVADGMGGLPGGDVASALAVSLLEGAFTGGSIDELGAAARAANRAILERADANADLEGMGTTLCAIGLTGDDELAIVNVGDSRAYLARDGAVSQLTEDHSVTADLVRRGEITPGEALDHPHRGVLTRVLGGGPTVDVDSSIHPALPGDRLLLCTDGLFNEVPHEEIVAAITSSTAIADLANGLVEEALANGGHDNITVVVAEVCS